MWPERFYQCGTWYAESSRKNDRTNRWICGIYNSDGTKWNGIQVGSPVDLVPDHHNNVRIAIKWGKCILIFQYILWKWVKETAFKMEPGSPKGDALTHIPFLASCIPSRRKEHNSYLPWEGTFPIRMYLLLLSRRKSMPCPSHDTLIAVCSQCETSTTSNACSFPMNFCSKHSSSNFLLKPKKSWPSLCLFGLNYGSP